MAQLVDNTICKPLKVSLRAWGILGTMIHDRQGGTVQVPLFFAKGRNVYRVLVILKEKDRTFVDLEPRSRNAVIETTAVGRARKEMERCLENIRWACTHNVDSLRFTEDDQFVMVDCESKRVELPTQERPFQEMITIWKRTQSTSSSSM